MQKRPRKHALSVRWGTEETFQYCFDGIPQNSIVAAGTVGGSPRKRKDRDRFETGRPLPSASNTAEQPLRLVSGGAARKESV